ncbi:MAG: hypothetical protein Q9227_001686 [Pyrenula ochraceoflavens]
MRCAGNLIRTYFPLFPALFSLTIAQNEPCDEFTYPPTFGAVGEYDSDLKFTVGQQITLKWKSLDNGQDAGDEVSIWLMEDDDGGTCEFQSAANCAQIAQKTANNGQYPWTISRMSMHSGDIYYISAFYTSSPTNVASDLHFNTHYINITDGGSSSSTPVVVASPSPSTSTFLSSSSIISESSPPTESPSPNSPSPASPVSNPPGSSQGSQSSSSNGDPSQSAGDPSSTNAAANTKSPSNTDGATLAPTEALTTNRVSPSGASSKSTKITPTYSTSIHTITSSGQTTLLSSLVAISQSNLADIPASTSTSATSSASSSSGSSSNSSSSSSSSSTKLPLGLGLGLGIPLLLLALAALIFLSIRHGRRRAEQQQAAHNRASTATISYSPVEPYEVGGEGVERKGRHASMQASEIWGKPVHEVVGSYRGMERPRGGGGGGSLPGYVESGGRERERERTGSQRFGGGSPPVYYESGGRERERMRSRHEMQG